MIKRHDIACEDLEDEIIEKNRIFLTGAGRTSLIMNCKLLQKLLIYYRNKGNDKLIKRTRPLVSALWKC